MLYSCKGRKKKGRGLPWWVVALLLAGVGGGLVGCTGGGTPEDAPTLERLRECTQAVTPRPGPSIVEDVAGWTANGYIVFVNGAEFEPAAQRWDPYRMKEVESAYSDAVENGYVSGVGFGSWEPWASAFRITQAPAPHMGVVGRAVRMLYIKGPGNQSGRTTAPYANSPIYGRIPTIHYHSVRWSYPDFDEAVHELAHVWDGAYMYKLGWEMEQRVHVSREGDTTVQPEGYGSFPTFYAETDSMEDFADSVMAYFYLAQGRYAYGRFRTCWTDEDPACRHRRDYDETFSFEYDRYDYIEGLFSGNL